MDTHTIHMCMYHVCHGQYHMYIHMCVFARDDQLVPVAIDQILVAVLVKLPHTGWRNSVVQ